MIREEQIKQANPMKLSKEEYKLWMKYDDGNYDYRAHYSMGFEDGAKWADEHPNWHDYETDRSFPNDVILHTTEGTFSAEYDNHLNLFASGGEWIDESTIIAWMELPKYSELI